MRKILSFVLVLSLVMSSFSMAFAADAKTAAGLSDISANANKDAIQVAYDLGIVTGNPDGTFLPTKDVNRAEFAAMLTRALDIPASALAGYTTTSFKDISGYAWAVPYLAFCQSKGILLGDGAGNVFPGKTITVNEAMTMALRAIGYTANSSLLVGAWPANYVSIAQNSDLYDDVAKTTAVNKASAAQIIYNLLTVQKVAVNSDGSTEYLWNGKQSLGVESNLLNTNLGCKEKEDVILGDEYDYDNSLINITSDIGAFGDAYLNDDSDLVAFTKHDCAPLTGKVSDDQKKFEVDDVDYDFSTNSFTSDAAFFTNATKDFTTTTAISAATIASYAAVNADGGDTVTIYADISGKKIKDIYSVSAWEATDTKKAPKDVQEDIKDNKLLGCEFAQNDDDSNDLTSFQLDGVTSLDKIAEDNVVYVYEATDSDKHIRKVAVGTEKVEGTVDEINEDDKALTIGSKEYDIASVKSAVKVSDFDTDSDGTFFLDAYGDIYDYDGTNGIDTYAVIKAASPGDSYDNVKLKLYKSDDSTGTYYLSEDDATEIDWTTNAAHSLTGATKTTVPALTVGLLAGYSLDKDGKVDALNISSGALGTTVDAVLKSSKVLSDGVRSYNVDSAAVAFTYEGSITNTGSYDVANIKDIDAGTVIANTASPGAFILDDDGNVEAIFVNKDLAKISSDAVYGVLNTRATAKDASGDAVYKYTGFIDGNTFTYKTDDQATDVKWDLSKGLFGVYAITLDANKEITKIETLKDVSTTSKVSKLVNDTKGAEIIKSLDEDNTVVTTTTGGKYTIDDKAVVYKYSKKDKEFTTAKISSLDDGDTIALYDTKDDDYDGVATVVIYIEK